MFLYKNEIIIHLLKIILAKILKKIKVELFYITFK